jgi:hypothetical protein
MNLTSIMKKLLYLLAIIPFLFACKKDDTIAKDQRRIKQVTISNDAVYGAIKTFYSYDNNQLVNRSTLVKSNSSYNTWDTTIKVNYSYSGSIVTAIAYLGDEGELHLGEKAEYEFVDELMSRFKYYEYVDGEFVSRYEYLFNYNGDLLESFDYYSDTANDGILYKVSKGEYYYYGDLCERFRIKDVYFDEYFYNEDFKYENGLLDSWESKENYRLNNVWKKLNREEYEYNSDNDLEKTKVYDWHFKWSYSYSVTFVYENRNLIKEDYSDATYGLDVDYIYEDGQGNSEDFYYTPMDRVYNTPIIENINNGSINAKLNFRNRIND